MEQEGARIAGRARAVEAAVSGGLTASCWRSVSQPDLLLLIFQLLLCFPRFSRSPEAPSALLAGPGKLLSFMGIPDKRHLYFV